MEALLPAFKERDYACVLTLLNPTTSTTTTKTTTTAPTASDAVAALTESPTLGPPSLALYKAAAAALAQEGLEGEALVLLARGYREGHLSEAALRRGYDGVLWALRLGGLGDGKAGKRMLAVVDAVGRGKVRPSDGGYIPLLEALGVAAAQEGDAGASEMIYQVLVERVGLDASLPGARKAVVFGLGLKGLVEARRPEPGSGPPVVGWARLLALKEGMQRWQVPLVGQHWGLLATGLAAEGRVAECLALLQEEDGAASARVVNMALAGLLRYQQQQQQAEEGKAEEQGAALWEGAIRLLSLLQQRAQRERPTSHGVTAALLICGRAGQWPLALRLWDEALWWDTHTSSAPSSSPHALDSATLNAAFEVLPPLEEEEKDEEEEEGHDATSSRLLWLFGPRLYRQGVAAGLSPGWRRKPQRHNHKTLVIDLHDHSLRMALYGALPDALHALRTLQAQRKPFPREVHIVTGHGTGRGRYRGLAPHHKPAFDAVAAAGGVGVLYPRVRRWAEQHVGRDGGVFEVSLGCVGIKGEALRGALPALLGSVS